MKITESFIFEAGSTDFGRSYALPFFFESRLFILSTGNNEILNIVLKIKCFEGKRKTIIQSNSRSLQGILLVLWRSPRECRQCLHTGQPSYSDPALKKSVFLGKLTSLPYVCYVTNYQHSRSWLVSRLYTHSSHSLSHVTHNRCTSYFPRNHHFPISAGFACYSSGAGEHKSHSLTWMFLLLC